MMTTIWTPLKKPPLIEKFCHLSLDAQKVLTALYRDFHQAKANITSSINSGPFSGFCERKPAFQIRRDQHDSHERQINDTSNIREESYKDSSSNSHESHIDGTANIVVDSCQDTISDSCSIVKNQTLLLPSGRENDSRYRFSVNATEDLYFGYGKTSGSEANVCASPQSSLDVDLSNNSPYSPPVETRDFMILSQFNPDRDTGSATIEQIDDSCSVFTEDLTVGNFDLVDAQSLLCENDKVMKQKSDTNRYKRTCHVNSTKYSPVISNKQVSLGSRFEHIDESPVVPGPFALERRFSELQTSVDLISNGKKRIPAEMEMSKNAKRLALDNPNSSNVGSKLHRKSADIVVIDTCTEENLRNIFTSIQREDEVLLTVVYSGGYTQLRDSVFDKENKRKYTNQTKKEVDVESFAICTMHQKVVYLFSSKTTKGNLDLVRTFWRDVLKADFIRKIGFRVKDFLVALLRCLDLDHDRIDFSWTVLDASVAAWLLDPDKPVSTYDELLNQLSMPKQTSFNGPCVNALPDDGALLSATMKKLFQKLQIRNLWDLFLCMETKLLPVLACMELRRIYVDVNMLLDISELLKKELSQLERKAHRAAGHPFVLNSHPQLRQVLFEELHMDSKLQGAGRLEKTSVTRETSTSEAVLQQLQDLHPLPGIVLEYRQLQKLKSCYVDGILGCVKDGYLCTHWDQISTGTGRLASYQPNIQAIPKQPVAIHDHSKTFVAGLFRNDVENRAVEFHPRDIFISKPDWSFLSADFQQIEFRLFSHLASDPTLLKVFSDDTSDIFKALTAEWMCKEVSAVTEADREQTKRVVYSLIYGIGKDKLAKYLKCSPADAKAVMSSFLGKFPAVAKYTKSCIEFCRQHGYTCSLFSRRRNFPNISHINAAVRAQAERQCVNFCVQGSAADICKAAMLQVERMMSEESAIKARLLMQIHDELLLEVADSDLPVVTEKVRHVMENTEALCGPSVRLRVPIRVSLSTGKTWGHMKPLDAAKP